MVAGTVGWSISCLLLAVQHVSLWFTRLMAVLDYHGYQLTGIVVVDAAFSANSTWLVE